MGNVIPFDNTLRVQVAAKKRPSPCRHRRSVVLDPDARTIQCDDCGAYVDPFDVLAGMMTQEIRLTSSREFLTYEVKRLRDERAELKREVQRLKSQRRYHSAKQG